MCAGGRKLVLAGDKDGAARAERRLLRQPPRLLRRAGQPRQGHPPLRRSRHVRRRRRTPRQERLFRCDAAFAKIIHF